LQGKVGGVPKKWKGGGLWTPLLRVKKLQGTTSSGGRQLKDEKNAQERIKINLTKRGGNIERWVEKKKN